jgi:hypothetical protein
MVFRILKFSKFPILVYKLYYLSHDEIKIIEGDR